MSVPLQYTHVRISQENGGLPTSSPSSYYPVPSSRINWKDLPHIERLENPLMSQEDKDLMRKWTRDHEKCDRKHMVTEEITKYRAGLFL